MDSVYCESSFAFYVGDIAICPSWWWFEFNFGTHRVSIFIWNFFFPDVGRSVFIWFGHFDLIVIGVIPKSGFIVGIKIWILLILPMWDGERVCYQDLQLLFNQASVNQTNPIIKIINWFSIIGETNSNLCSFFFSASGNVFVASVLSAIAGVRATRLTQ